jgi:hypothetical protein
LFGVKDIQADVQRLRLGQRRQAPLDAALLLEQTQSLGYTSARITAHLFQMAERLQGLRPGVSLAVDRSLAEQQGQAGRFDPRQHGLAVKENLIRTQGACQRPTVFIEHPQDRSGLLFGLSHPASQGRASRGLVGAEEENKDAEHLVEADAQGGEQDRQLSLACRSEVDDSVEPPLAVLQLLSELSVVVQQLLAAGTGLVSLDEGLLDLVGVLVDGLSAAVGLLRLSGNGAVRADQSGSGIADPGNEA